MQFSSEFLRRLKTAGHLVAFTGAGMSAESGVPTFRDAQTGLWSTFKPEELATPEAFQRNPKLVWDWYAERRTTIANIQPNAGHRALATMEAVFKTVTVVTQNIDNLHKRAGQSVVHELHGNIGRVKCFRENTIIDQWSVDQIPPKCPNCGAYLRPDVVWFGELLPAGEFQSAENACRSCDVLLSIGTSGIVYPAAGLPYLALQSGAYVVEINPEATPFTGHAHESLRGPAGEILPKILEALK